MFIIAVLDGKFIRAVIIKVILRKKLKQSTPYLKLLLIKCTIHKHLKNVH